MNTLFNYKKAIYADQTVLSILIQTMIQELYFTFDCDTLKPEIYRRYAQYNCVKSCNNVHIAKTNA